jgi:hypothetical protein
MIDRHTAWIWLDHHRLGVGLPIHREANRIVAGLEARWTATSGTDGSRWRCAFRR